MKKLLSANEALARGVYEAGIHFAAGYPGTPSTEVLENLAKYDGIDVQWSANEKVAFDNAVGASIGGARVLVTMKHVGLNVAADSFMVLPYAGINGGFIVLSADDPGMHSSQNEQDNRYFAKFGKLPLLEPSNSAEILEYVRKAYEISEKFNTPVMLRTTTRIAHTKSIVELSERAECPKRKLKKDSAQNVVPINAKKLRVVLENKMNEISEYSNTFSLNKVEYNEKSDVAFISYGIPFCYAMEAFPDASYFKLGMTFPLPLKAIKDFCSKFETVYIIEEGEPFIEEQLKYFGINNIIGKEKLSNVGEISVEVLEAAFNGIPVRNDFSNEINIPPRPPLFCAGCPHRGLFHSLKKLKVYAAGDIGCYTMAALPPWNVLDTVFCMGSSIANASGLQRVAPEDEKKKYVAVIGDGTFIHGGIPALINSVYNGDRLTTIICDNSTTGMTGQQDHPGTGKTIKGAPAPRVKLEEICKAAGIEEISVVNPNNFDETFETLKKAINSDVNNVVITRAPCMMLPAMKKLKKPPYMIDSEACKECGACIRFQCPAISKLPSNKACIDAALCIGCGQCVQLCKFDAIKLAEKD